jgi:hypothetical protein
MKLVKKLIQFVSFNILSPFNWARIKFLLTGREYDVTAQDREYVRGLCAQGVYIWLTRRETHLTTYLIGFSDYALGLMAYYRNGRKGKKPKLGYYAHAFLNTDADTFIEAVSSGVQYNYFDNVFNVDAFAALIPTGLTAVEWAMFSKKFVEVSESKLGAKYDAVFNLKDETEVSCGELIRVSLRHCMSDERYNLRFKNFEALIKERRNLTPDMIRECEDFTVITEMRR